MGEVGLEEFTRRGMDAANGDKVGIGDKTQRKSNPAPLSAKGAAPIRTICSLVGPKVSKSTNQVGGKDHVERTGN